MREFFNLDYKFLPINTLSKYLSKAKTLIPSEKFGVFVVVFLSFATIMFKGSFSEGQKNLFSAILENYSEETVASVITASRNQIGELSSIYLNESSASVAQTFEKSILQNNTLLSYNSIETDLDLIEQPVDRDFVSNYFVQKGDTLSFIASDFGVSMNSIIWANGLSNIDYLSPGTELKIPPVSGILHVVRSGDTVDEIAKQYDVTAESIIEFNKLPKDGSIKIRAELIIPDGTLPSDQDINYASSNVQRFRYLPRLDGYFMSPAQGLNWGTLHGRNGVDIASACETGIYAAASGTVTISDSSGWNGGFGKHIKIVHPNETETVYAHNSANLVSIGEYVTQGQLIAKMGTTGRSTGCHLHFEVHGANNPLAKY